MLQASAGRVRFGQAGRYQDEPSPERVRSHERARRFQACISDRQHGCRRERRIRCGGCCADNDVAALNGFFFDSPFTIRYGIAENLYGYPEIQAFRSAVVASGVGPRRERTVITTYGNDFATVSTLSRRPQAGKVGRTMQTWVRFPQGWRIVAAHVSTIDDPAKP